MNFEYVEIEEVEFGNWKVMRHKIGELMLDLTTRNAR